MSDYLLRPHVHGPGGCATSRND
eukprot:COSAG05_NODE_8665_length_682_cov_1.101201_2_plen_22_part_01